MLDHGFSNAPFSDPTAGRSLWRRVHGDRESLLGDWPFDRPAEWVEWVNAAQTEAEIEALRKCVNRGMPYGTETWKTQIAATLGLKSTLQPRGTEKALGINQHANVKRFASLFPPPARRRGDREQDVVELNSKAPVRDKRKKKQESLEVKV